AASDPQRSDRRLALPNDLQLRGGLPPWHPRHRRHRGGQAGHRVWHERHHVGVSVYSDAPSCALTWAIASSTVAVGLIAVSAQRRRSISSSIFFLPSTSLTRWKARVSCSGVSS